MKHSLIALLFIATIFSQQTVAVLDFEGIGVSQEEAKALSNRFGSEFLELAGYKFTLVERQAMGEILKEQGLQQTGCVSSECAVEVGAALGAQLIIIGSISKVGSIFSVNARMLDVETAKILKSINYDQVGDIGLLLTKGMRKAAAKMLGFELYSNFELKVDKPTQFAEPNKSLNIQGIQKTSSSDYSITTISSLIANGGFGIYPSIKLISGEYNERTKSAWYVQMMGGLIMILGMSINEEPDNKGGPFIIGGWVAGVVFSIYIDLTQASYEEQKNI